MSYQQTTSTRTTYSSSSSQPGTRKVTEIRTVTGPDGKTTTERRTFGGGADELSNNLGKMNVGKRGGGNTNSITRTLHNPVEASRYSKGWGSRREKPALTPTGAPMKLTGKTFTEIRDQCLKEGRLFEDPDFPAVDESLFYSRKPPRPFVWKRPPEFKSDPQLFVDGASRFDVKQGELGDCWLLAAVASLCQYKDLLYRVVPRDQSFTDRYAGIFHFQFWQYGKWEDIIVDDRLPTYYDRLVFMHSEDANEFWTPLIEKAYAKLMGSYEALKGGATSEAMEDFTGGMTEMFDLRQNVPPNLFSIMTKAFARSSLMGCSIEAMPGKLEAELPNGLIMGHAYSITCVKSVTVKTPRTSGQIPMVRIRNPWGNEAEWNGAWSDKSKEWQFIPEEERKSLGLTFDDDGEFWMSFKDFSTNFQKLEICNLGPESAIEGKLSFEETKNDGSWKKRVNAGGCRNFLETFWTNPQYRVTVTDTDDDDDDLGTVIVALMQKNRRKMRKEGADLLVLGYAIYKCPDELPTDSTSPLDMKFFKYNASVGKSPSFINMREICGRHKLSPGTYCIIPSTFEQNQDGDFLLRIYSEKANQSSEMDEETGMSDVQPSIAVTEADKTQDETTRAAFRQIAGEDMEVDAYELMDILNAAFMKDFKFEGFTAETCRSMVAMMDVDRSGKLGFDEFQKLWNDLRLWKTVFTTFDKDKSGNFNSYELRQAFHASGFKVSNSTFNALVQRYTHRDGKIHFDDFIHCTVRIKTMFEIFNEQREGAPKAAFALDEFIQTTMYS